MAIDPQDMMLTEQQRRMLADLAARTGRPWNDLLTEAIGSYHPLDAAKSTTAGGSFYDTMKDVIGIVSGAPADLSTNPRHLEEFGRDHHTGAH